MFGLDKLFHRRRSYGKTVRNGYLDEHGYYLARAKRKPLSRNGHSAANLPYAVADLIKSKLKKDCSAYIRWDIFSYRWALRHCDHTASCRISMQRKNSYSHRHFVRTGDQSKEALENYTLDHANKFDLIIFDGPGKAAEAALILPMLKNNGVVIVVDDFDDPYDFSQTLDFFRQQNMKTLVLCNPSPMHDALNSAIVYRAENFLDL